MTLEAATAAVSAGQSVELVSKVLDTWTRHSCWIEDGVLVHSLEHEHNPVTAPTGRYYVIATTPEQIAEDAADYTACASAELEADLQDEDEWRNHGGL